MSCSFIHGNSEQWQQPASAWALAHLQIGGVFSRWRQSMGSCNISRLLPGCSTITLFKVFVLYLQENNDVKQPMVIPYMYAAGCIRTKGDSATWSLDCYDWTLKALVTSWLHVLCRKWHHSYICWIIPPSTRSVLVVRTHCRTGRRPWTDQRSRFRGRPACLWSRIQVAATDK